MRCFHRLQVVSLTSKPQALIDGMESLGAEYVRRARKSSVETFSELLSCELAKDPKLCVLSPLAWGGIDLKS